MAWDGPPLPFLSDHHQTFILQIPGAQPKLFFHSVVYRAMDHLKPWHHITKMTIQDVPPKKNAPKKTLPSFT